jgi:hypothetical protein
VEFANLGEIAHAINSVRLLHKFLGLLKVPHAAGNACICLSSDCALPGLDIFHHFASARRNAVNCLEKRPTHCDTRFRFEWIQFDRRCPTSTRNRSICGLTAPASAGLPCAGFSAEAIEAMHTTCDIGEIIFDTRLAAPAIEDRRIGGLREAGQRLLAGEIDTKTIAKLCLTPAETRLAIALFKGQSVEAYPNRTYTFLATYGGSHGVTRQKVVIAVLSWNKVNPSGVISAWATQSLG